MNSPFAPTDLTDARDGALSEPLTLANARLVLPDTVLRGRITLVDGRIAAIEDGDGAVDCGGDYVMPGLVELHTDNLERHIEPRPEVGWPHLPALLAHDAELASTGITTVFDALRVGSIHTGKAGYGAYARNLADIGLPILLWDERLSTASADAAMIDQRLSRAKRAQKIDAQAAAVILQSALDRLTGSAF